MKALALIVIVAGIVALGAGGLRDTRAQSLFIVTGASGTVGAHHSVRIDLVAGVIATVGGLVLCVAQRRRVQRAAGRSRGRGRIVTPLLGMCLALVLLSGCVGRPSVEDYRVGRAIHAQIGHLSKKETGPPGIDRVGALVRSAYRRPLYSPLWSRAGALGHPAQELIDVLRNAGNEGLNPDVYGLPRIDALLDGAKKTRLSDPERLGELDLLLTHAFVLYASHMASGQISPRSIEANWYTRPDRADLLALLQRARAHDSVRATLADLAPRHQGYRALKTAYATYRDLMAHGGWPAIPPGPALHVGSRGPRVAALARRLAAEGFLALGDTTAVFGPPMHAAVQRFEARVGQLTDGVVDGEVLAQLNVPVQTRVRTMELNLERWRWLPPAFEPRYLMVNIPGYSLSAIENDRTVWSMRVVVGKLYTPTPVFAATMRYLVLNPTWNVPLSIVRNEIIPALDRDPGYLAKKHMRFVDSHGDPVDDSDPDTEALHSGAVQVQQAAGDDNALGRVKFMFPNPFDIYLHDTPTRFFSKEDRALSHGCIRVEYPLALAQYVLRGSGDWDSTRVRHVFETTDETQTVNLPHPLPVHILYWTAWADQDGHVQFRDDIYQLDARLDKALQMPHPAADNASRGIQRDQKGTIRPTVVLPNSWRTASSDAAVLVVAAVYLGRSRHAGRLVRIPVGDRFGRHRARAARIRTGHRAA